MAIKPVHQPLQGRQLPNRCQEFLRAPQELPRAPQELPRTPQERAHNPGRVRRLGTQQVAGPRPGRLLSQFVARTFPTHIATRGYDLLTRPITFHLVAILPRD
jgi:hypothetical protein